MKRAVAGVVMLVVGLSLVVSAEAFCVYNNTGHKIQANVTIIGVSKSAFYTFTISPSSKNCEDQSASFTPTQVKVTFTFADYPKSLCSITMSSAKDVEVNVVNENKYSCSEKK